MRSALLILLAAAALTLTACNRDNTRARRCAARPTRARATAASSTDRTGDGGGITVSPLEAEQRRLMQQLVIYFDYDQADIRPEFNAMLQAHGQ